MKRICLVCGVALLCGAGVFVGNVLAQEEEAPAGGGMGMTPPWMKKTEHHEAFAKQVGEWTGAMTWTMEGMPPMQGTASVTAKLVFNGNFIQHDVAGGMPGMSFKGRWIMGYDTIDEEFVSIWLEDMSPIPSIGRGSEEDGVIVFYSDGVNPMTGEKVAEKSTLEWKGDDQMVYTFYHVVDDGDDKQFGQIVYTRKK